MKKCTYIEKLLYPYLDGELDVGQNLIVEEHILNCQKCCDLLNEEKRFLHVIKNACRKKEGPPALKAKIERMLDKKQRPFFHIFPNHPFKMAFAAALAGMFIALFSGNLLDLGSSKTPPFVRALVENHLKIIDKNLPLEIESHDPQVVMAWFKKRIEFMPDLPVLKDDKVVLLGGRLAKFRGENMALISYRLEKSPVTMSIIKGNPTAFVESSDFTFLHGRRFNFSRQHGFNTIAWTDDGKNFALISSLESQKIVSCKVCHAQGSGLSDLNELLGI
jgi:anti-sigma factor RsiW